MKKILFICTGNTCRSPFAELLLKKLSSQKGFNVETTSAGTSAASDGSSAPELALRVAREHGIDLSSHRSKPVTEPLLGEADIILTMTGGHRDWLLHIFPHTLGKVNLISDFAIGEREWVEDPYGGTEDDYRRSFGKIQMYVESMLFKGTLERWLKEQEK